MSLFLALIFSRNNSDWPQIEIKKVLSILSQDFISIGTKNGPNDISPFRPNTKKKGDSRRIQESTFFLMLRLKIDVFSSYSSKNPHTKLKIDNTYFTTICGQSE